MNRHRQLSNGEPTVSLANPHWRTAVAIYGMLREHLSQSFAVQSLSPNLLWQGDHYSTNVFHCLRRVKKVDMMEFLKSFQSFACELSPVEVSSVMQSDTGLLEIRPSSLHAFPLSVVAVDVRSADRAGESYVVGLHRELAARMLRWQMEHHEHSIIYEHQVVWKTSWERALTEMVAVPNSFGVVMAEAGEAPPQSFCAVASEGFQSRAALAIGLRLLISSASRETIFAEPPELLKTSENVLWFWASLLERLSSLGTTLPKSLDVITSDVEDFFDVVWEFWLSGSRRSFPHQMLRASQCLSSELSHPDRALRLRNPTTSVAVASSARLLRSFFEFFDLSLHSENHVL